MSQSDTITASSDVQRTDFVSIPVQDIDRVEPRSSKMAFFKDTEGNALMLHRRYAP